MANEESPSIFRIKRGLEANRTSVTPLVGEMLWTTDEKKLYVGDGVTAGGVRVVTEGVEVDFDNTDAPDLAANVQAALVETWQAGNWSPGQNRTSGTRYFAASLITGTVNAAIGAGAIAYTPICIGREQTFSDITCNVQTAGSNNARLALYENDFGIPGALIEDVGEVSVASTGEKQVAFSSPRTLEAGWYWLAFQVQTGATFTCLQATTGLALIGSSSITAPLKNMLYQVRAYAAFPATASVTADLLSQTPLLGLVVN